MPVQHGKGVLGWSLHRGVLFVRHVQMTRSALRRLNKISRHNDWTRHSWLAMHNRKRSAEALTHDDSLAAAATKTHSEHQLFSATKKILTHKQCMHNTYQAVQYTVPLGGQAYVLLLLMLEHHGMPANTIRPLFYRRTTFSSAKLTSRPIAVTITQLQQQHHAQHLRNSCCGMNTHTYNCLASKACLSITTNQDNVFCTCLTTTLASAAKKHVHKDILAAA